MTADGKKVSIVMGSISDEKVMKKASDVLKGFGVDCEVNILSAHRMPNKTSEFAKNAEGRGIEVIIAKAGKPMARISRIEKNSSKIRFGILKGKVKVSENFDAPLPDDLLSKFEGN